MLLWGVFCDIKEGALLENKSPLQVSRWKMSQNLDWIFGNVPGNSASLELYLQLVSVYRKPSSRNTCSSKRRCLLLVSSSPTTLVILRHVLCEDVESATWCWSALYYKYGQCCRSSLVQLAFASVSSVQCHLRLIWMM